MIAESLLTSPTRPPGGACEFLSFSLAGGDFCLPVANVREIRSWSEPTPLPLSDPAILGVINLRGTILPVIDLARKLALPPSAKIWDVIIVIADSGRMAGFAVDKVDDVLTFPVSALSPPPVLTNSGIAVGLSGVILVQDRYMPVLDTARLMSFQNLDMS